MSSNHPPRTCARDLQPIFESVGRVFSVLGEPARLRILHALCQEERCVNDIIQVTGLAQANVSRHLGRLYQAGLLVRRREGAQVFYRVADSAPLDLCRVIAAQVMARQGSAQRDGDRFSSVFPLDTKEQASV
ncbi:MAG: metalloregulator ArsR/SmtB family transcription factor [Tepidimonas sp.]|uniref:ArsR/SmtB family transcription factor n=1 Tax=Tepidimonas sp. TaxID=2002775 RepID=UPI00298F0C89|nr:metalloregulator ArsR/SmtB family transcription factor [Tepidimonas sp.]MCS6810844.1 metalloregulator ArsR/SmtB family transcription factor [Tepidimonas sp.]MDW8336640.1 metalloregulator ArsR/SmtB family transcription factor [Tepidimonas sp.]